MSIHTGDPSFGGVQPDISRVQEWDTVLNETNDGLET